MKLSESDAIEDADEPKRVRAIAYYGSSAERQQADSISIQQDQVREWAENNGVDIIHEFSDAGKSGLNSEDRPAFTEMMEEWVTKRTDFSYILCLDASRLSRFQDNDCAIQLSDQCKENEKQLIYTITGKWLGHFPRLSD